MSELFDVLQRALNGRYAFELRPDGTPPLLGRGGMAEVYLASDLRHPRRVAIKVLQPAVARALGPERFLREIEIAAGFSHLNTIPLLEAGSADLGQGPPLLWYAMPFVAGETLRERLARESQLPIEEALRLTRETADGLAYAHSQGIVHRDIKPENILLQAGHAVIADFGLARAMSAAAEEITSAGFAVGTPAYMSPEQGAGGKHLDGRSDIYSLGCVLYEMLVGEPPFTGPSAQAIIARHQVEPPRSIRVVRPTISRELEALVERALAKVPADRFGSAAEFASALDLPPERWAAHAGGGGSAWSWRPWLVALGAVALVLVGVFGPIPRGELDPNRIVVFPVGVGAAGRRDTSLASDATVAILAALNSTNTLVAVDGRRSGAKEAPEGVARRQRAGSYVNLSVLHSDSLHLTFELHSLVRDSTIRRLLSLGPETDGWHVGLSAARELIPLVIPTSNTPDIPALASVHPAALAEFLRGEQLYWESSFEAALKQYKKALDIDSTFALAALHGAVAATWVRDSAARAFAGIAARRQTKLPPRERPVAEGLVEYLAGDGSAAATRLRAAIAADPESLEGWMLLGESYTHLLPGLGQLDSMANAAFERVHELDPRFTPVLFHLIEGAVRQGDSLRMRRLLTEFRRAAPDSTELLQAELMVHCATSSMSPAAWREAASRAFEAVFAAAQSLSVAGLRQAACARSAWEGFLGFEATRANPRASAWRFGALIGLQNVLVALGHEDSVVALWRSDTVTNIGYGGQVLVLDALASGRFRAIADSFTTERLQALVQGDSVTSWELWLAGSWRARRGGPTADVATASASLGARTRRGGSTHDSLLSRSLAAQLTLAQGDTGAALSLLQGLAPPRTSRDLLAWRPWFSLGYERMLLAEVLLARRRSPEALKVAATFDAPAPLFYVIYLPASLALRARAADEWAEQAVSRRSRDRLRGLGQEARLGPRE